MGTRHLIAVQIDGQYPIAQYGQWDGYPDGQGMTVLRFLRDELRRGDLIAKAKAAPEMTQEMRSAKLRELGHDGSDWVKDDVASAYYKRYPQLSRDVGGKILAMVQNGEMGAPLCREITFAGESLMCEWAWVVDLDKNTFEAFKGFNKEPVDPSERFASVPYDEKAKSSDGKQYYQVRHVKTWSLDALPTDEEFMAAFAEPEDDAEQEGNRPMTTAMDTDPGTPEERLRKAAAWAFDDNRPLMASACLDGAAEIERLRARVLELEAQLERMEHGTP